MEAGCIVLIPHGKKTRKGKIFADPVTGLPALSAGDAAPALSSKEVDEILASFP